MPFKCLSFCAKFCILVQPSAKKNEIAWLRTRRLGGQVVVEPISILSAYKSKFCQKMVECLGAHFHINHHMYPHAFLKNLSMKFCVRVTCPRTANMILFVNINK